MTSSSVWKVDFKKLEPAVTSKSWMSHSFLKQLMSLKPTKRSIKMWMRCDSKAGDTSVFNIFSGRENGLLAGTLGKRVVNCLANTNRQPADKIMRSFNFLFLGMLWIKIQQTVWRPFFSLPVLECLTFWTSCQQNPKNANLFSFLFSIWTSIHLLETLNYPILVNRKKIAKGHSIKDKERWSDLQKQLII